MYASNILPYKRIHDGKTLFKRATESKHFLKIPEGIAIDRKVFEEGVSGGVIFVQIFGREMGLYYTATVEIFQKKGMLMDRGYGEQIALPMRWWLKSSKPGIPCSLKGTKLKQPGLFDMAGAW